MATKSERRRGRNGTLSSLNVAIEGINLAKEISIISPASTVFGLVAPLLTMIRVCPLPARDRVFWSHKQQGLDDQ